jgi:mono/diheme cytochrome c family protein
MRAPLLMIALAAMAGCDSAAQVTFADASITLPDDPIDLPPGPGADAVVANCIACHSPSTMLQQPRMSREKWLSTITKMRETYKAPVDEAAIPQIVDYLMAAQEAEAAREAATP